MNLAGVQHSATSKDCFCLEKGTFLFRLRTAKNDMAAVIMHYQDKYLPLKIMDTRAHKVMVKVGCDHVFDYWELKLSFDVVCLRYWFELKDMDGKVIYYANYCFTDSPLWDIENMFDCPQNLREEEVFTVPSWAKNKVIYQIFPSRFATTEDVADKDWYKAPITMWDNLHGNLRGIINHLDHIKNLGVDIIYMTPIFRSDSCHKYDTIDYYTIEPTFGSKDDLKELVNKAHACGMYVILDGVFNHTSPEFFAFKDIRENKWQSKYIDWYFIKEFPLKMKWGEKPNYKTFSYFGGMPKLNIKNPEVADYVTNVALYWLRECGIDGWRLDVGDEISHYFWRSFRKRIKAEFPEALIIGEVWHHAEDFLRGDEWDTVMNYPFFRSVLKLVTGRGSKVSTFVGELDFAKGQLHPRVIPLLWNLIDSHDTARVLNMCGKNKDKMRLIVALQLLSPGMPMIYYGDEYAMEGDNDPDCRRGMVWDPKRQDRDMFAWYQMLIRVRKTCPEILDRECIMTTDDKRGLLMVESKNYLLIFNCMKGRQKISGYEDALDLIRSESFSGVMDGFSVNMFRKKA